MRRRKEQQVDDIVAAFLHETGLETQYLQYRVTQLWEEVIKQEIAALSYAIEVKGDILWVAVKSPALASELQMRKSQLVAQLNHLVGANIVSDIRFTLHNPDQKGIALP